jgi:Ca2+-binding RTX toxin-like protein
VVSGANIYTNDVFSASTIITGIVLTGTAGADSLTGGTGNDTIDGLAGNDTLNGGLGADNMTGGSGNDSYTVDDAGDTVIETSTLASELDTVNSSITYTLGANVEKLILTGTAAINGTGNGLANTLTGNTGANVLTGGLGNDIYFIDAGDTVVETSTLANEIDTVNSSITYTLGANVEKLTLTGTAAIDGTGNGLANTLTGNTGANVLTGGLGNDTYFIGAGDTVVETSTLVNEIDTVNSSITYTLGANVEKLILTGTAAINGTGNGLANTLTGNTGANILTGGLGNDTYVIGAGDTVVETSTLATEIDTVNSSVTYTLAANVEKLTLMGTTAINGAGNGLANTLTGNTAANVLSGDAGNDVLNGGAGSDNLTGGVGLDTFLFNTALTTTGIDTITDFNATDDTIKLENAIFTKLTTLGTLNAANFKIGAAAADVDDFVVYNDSTGALFYDADGSGTGAAVQIALLGTTTTHPAVTNTDFVVI